MIDNHDSFVYNLYRYLDEILPGQVRVMKNDEVDFGQLSLAQMIIISPGPDLPEKAGRTMEVIKLFNERIPILGVCLGHQCIIEYYGGKLFRLENVCHGVVSEVEIIDKSDVLYKNVGSPFKAGRYHSWVASTDFLPVELKVTSIDSKGAIMSVAHKQLPVFGVQFHPESIMTTEGRKILLNFVKFARIRMKNKGNVEI